MRDYRPTYKRKVASRVACHFGFGAKQMHFTYNVDSVSGSAEKLPDAVATKQHLARRNLVASQAVAAAQVKSAREQNVRAESARATSLPLVHVVLCFLLLKLSQSVP